MALIVEDGTGLSNAESFASVEQADSYFGGRGNVAWGALSVARREQCLRLATDYLEAQFGRKWRSKRLTEAQALSWPRIGWAGVPKQVRTACIELAFRASGGELMPDEGPAVASERVGPLLVSYSTERRYRFPHIWQLVSPLLAVDQVVRA